MSMIECVLPPNETERLAAVHSLQILDTPIEDRFDRIVRLTATLFEVPVSYVAIIDRDRQWLKSSCGLTFRESSRAESFCGHAILGTNPLVVPDTRLDERFFDNPLVVNEPFIRFYAGQPLSDGKGHQIGTLCIADHRPRFLSERDLLLLCDLGAMVEREIGLMDAIRLQEALIEAEQRAIDAERARNEFLAELVTSQKRLASELAEAAAYVRSILPEPLRNGIVSHWCFEPCSQLGGDAFGYHWLSGDRLAIYLLDVCGHGIGSALLSVSAINSLRSQALPEADFDQPASVLAALNRAFPMAQQDNKFFTIWYGVFDRRSRTLDYGSAGHPAALLFEPSSPGPGTLLGMNSSMIGIDEESSFESRRVTAPPGSHLYVFSDGAFDLPDAGGERFGYENLAQYLRDQAGSPSPVVDRVAEHIKKMSGSATLPDDFSMIEFRL